MEMFMEMKLTGIHKQLTTSATFELFHSMIIFMIPETGQRKAYLAADSTRIG